MRVVKQRLTIFFDAWDNKTQLLQAEQLVLMLEVRQQGEVLGELKVERIDSVSTVQLLCESCENGTAKMPRTATVASFPMRRNGSLSLQLCSACPAHTTTGGCRPPMSLSVLIDALKALTAHGSA